MSDQALEMHIPRKGATSVLSAVERRLPPPAAGEVRVAIEAVGVAYADIMMRQGVYAGHKPPVTPGYDLVGRVEAIGPEVSDLAIGQRVAGITVFGSYATRRNVAARWLVPAPEGVDAGRLVAAVLNGVTAWQMLHRVANPAPGEWVLVHGAGGGVAAAFDHLGGKHFKTVSMPALRPGGVGVFYGAYDVSRGGKVNPLAVADLLLNARFSSLDLFAKGQGVVAYSSEPWRDGRPAAYRSDLSTVLKLVADGVLTPEVGATYPLRAAADAHRALEARSVTGKIVLLND